MPLSVLCFYALEWFARFNALDPSGWEQPFSLTLSRWERENICRRLANPTRSDDSQRGLRGSLSQRERAGVRENVYALEWFARFNALDPSGWE